MNETILDKGTYQTNRWGMCWVALGMMTACMVATISTLYQRLRPIVF
ncbi:hypothetical protein N9E48_01940 [Paracoccaceae bacterium]|nr:hypothetical protein [Paracoccaceae bacterium]